MSAAASAVYLSPATLSAQDHLTSELLRTFFKGGCQAKPPGRLSDPTSFSTYTLRGLAGDLGCFLDYEAYPRSLTAALSHLGIRSLADVSNLVGPIGHPAVLLPPR